MPGPAAGRVTFLLAAAVALGAFRQTPPAPQQPVFRSTVDLVQVDVVVVDKEGQPVRGLAKEDFAVLDRRKAQTIAVFEEVDHRSGTGPAPGAWPLLARDVADNRSAQSQRLVVVVAD